MNAQTLTLSPDEVWKAALSQLQLQTPKATFDAWLRNIHFIAASEDDAYILSVPNEGVRDWLDNRLRSTIERTLSNIAGRSLKVEFRLNGAAPRDAPAPEDKAHPAEEASKPETGEASGLTPGQLAAGEDYFRAFFGRGKDVAGYAMVSHYASRFIAPYLGPAFLLWKRLDADERTSIKDPAKRWSEPQIITYNGLKNAMDYPHTRYIGGQTMECSQSIRAIRETGQSLTQCCLKHSPARTKIDREGRPRCYFWYTGQLEILYQEKLLAIEVEKRGDHPRSRTIRVQIWRLLPILTPWQVGKLNGELQKAHQAWIEDFGHLLNLNYAVWKKITERTLVDLMEGYNEYRQLHTPYTFSAKFLQLPGRTRIGFTTPES